MKRISQRFSVNFTIPEQYAISAEELQKVIESCVTEAKGVLVAGPTNES